MFGWTRNGVEYRLSAIPFGGYVALPQLSDMGRLEGNETSTNQTDVQNQENRKSAWDDFDDDDDQSDKEEPLPKITYSDKMIVSVMGLRFQYSTRFRTLHSSVVFWIRCH